MSKNGYGLFLSVLVIGIGVFLGSFLCKDGSLEAKMFCGFGLIFMVIGGTPFIIELVKAIKKKKYRDAHAILPANIDRIEVIKECEEAGVHPVRLHCSYIQNGKTYQFVSYDLWDAPKYRVGDKVNVYVDPNDYSKYEIDAYKQF